MLLCKVLPANCLSSYFVLTSTLISPRPGMRILGADIAHSFSLFLTPSFNLSVGIQQ